MRPENNSPLEAAAIDAFELRIDEAPQFDAVQYEDELSTPWWITTIGHVAD